jgi:hypothetical protein
MRRGAEAGSPDCNRSALSGENMKKSQFNRTGTPFSFTYAFADEEGNPQEELINARLKQQTFRDSAKRAAEAQAAEDAAEAAAKDPEEALSYICDYLVSWDIEDDETDQPLTIDRETLALLPDNFLAQLITAMTEAMAKANPKKPSVQNSEDGSERAAQLASQAKKSLTTTDSPLPVDSGE